MKNKLLKDKTVAIIGGGPGGLMLARLLQQQGVDVTVYERDVDQNVRQQGSTLDMHYDTGLKAIETAGLLAEFKKLYRPGADKAVIINGNMDVLYDERNNTDKQEETFGDELFRPEIDRVVLRDMLIASLKKENVIWNSRFTELKAKESGWEILFENGNSAYADLVIAADGANSKLRKYMTAIAPVYSGITDIEGTIYRADLHTPKIWQLVKGGSLFALESGRSIKFITKGDGSLTMLIGLKKPEKWLENSGIDLTDRASVATWFAEEFAGWNPDWAELFATDMITFTPRVWYHFPADQQWKAQPNLTMIGDAAHRVPPYAGEGANQALADALDLYEALCFGDFETIEEAIASFEEKMFKRSAAITEESVLYAEQFHTENNLQFLMDLFGIDPATISGLHETTKP